MHRTAVPWMTLQVHPAARKKKAAPKPGSEEEAELHREQAEAAAWQEYQQGAPQGDEEVGVVCACLGKLQRP